MKKIFVDMDGVLADFVTGVTGPKYLNGPLVNENTYDDRKIELSNNESQKNKPKRQKIYDTAMNIIQTTTHKPKN